MNTANAGSISLAKEAYRVVRLRILEGHFQLGQLVSRRKIATELGMSFLPVSEALLRLEAEGLLESKARAGTRVRIPSAADLAGHYDVREALEMQAGRLFAERASSEDKARTLELAKEVDAAAGGDRAAYLTLHERLHRQIADLAHSPALAAEIERALALASAWMCVGPGARLGSTRHQDFVEQLIVASPATAAELMREHIRGKQIFAVERLTPYFDMRKVTYTRGARLMPHTAGLGSLS